MSGRSVRGCRTVSGKYGFVLLCEVELGKTSQPSSNSRNSAVHGDCRIKEIPNGVSHMPWCDATFTDPALKGVKIPGGRPGQTSDTTEPSKEYLIMDPAQICQRYLFHFKVY
jgi:poly [ADP-ribose] polymerase